MHEPFARRRVVTVDGSGVDTPVDGYDVFGMRAASIPARAAAPRPLRSRRLLALAGDERLVEQIRRGNEAAFEVAFERHGPAILAFCRHMVGSRDEAEDVVQHSFAAAYRDLQRDGERDIALKPWLFAIARNRCLSLLRARREQPIGDASAAGLGRRPVGEAGSTAGRRPVGAPDALSTVGLAEQVEQRAELRRLLADLRELPDEQRAALLLAEVGDLSHAEVAGVLGCEVPRVKALVFRARSALIARREARETPCVEIREQLANLRGGSLRRTGLRLHLRDCPGCRAYREQVKQQRRMLAALLPVSPSLGLKSSVLAAVGLGGGSAGGGAAAAGLTGVAGAFGGGAVAKVAVVGALAGAGVVAGDAMVDRQGDGRAVQPAGPPAAGAAKSGTGVTETRPATEAIRTRPAPATRDAVRRERGRGGGARSEGTGGGVGALRRSEARAKTTAPGLDKPKRREGRGHPGHAKQPKTEQDNPGRRLARGPVEAPPSRTPVKRGPPDKAPKSAKPAPPGKAKPAPPGKPRTAPQAKTRAPAGGKLKGASPPKARPKPTPPAKLKPAPPAAPGKAKSAPAKATAPGQTEAAPGKTATPGKAIATP
jgi:RNA polymerase sigma factor (sigma-70 family)